MIELHTCPDCTSILTRQLYRHLTDCKYMQWRDTIRGAILCWLHSSHITMNSRRDLLLLSTTTLPFINLSVVICEYMQLEGNQPSTATTSMHAKPKCLESNLSIFQLLSIQTTHTTSTQTELLVEQTYLYYLFFIIFINIFLFLIFVVCHFFTLYYSLSPPMDYYASIITRSKENSFKKNPE